MQSGCTLHCTTQCYCSNLHSTLVAAPRRGATGIECGGGVVDTQSTDNSAHCQCPTTRCSNRMTKTPLREGSTATGSAVAVKKNPCFATDHSCCARVRQRTTSSRQHSNVHKLLTTLCMVPTYQHSPKQLCQTPTHKQPAVVPRHSLAPSRIVIIKRSCQPQTWAATTKLTAANLVRGPGVVYSTADWPRPSWRL